MIVPPCPLFTEVGLSQNAPPCSFWPFLLARPQKVPGRFPSRARGGRGGHLCSLPSRALIVFARGGASDDPRRPDPTGRSNAVTILGALKFTGAGSTSRMTSRTRGCFRDKAPGVRQRRLPTTVLHLCGSCRQILVATFSFGFFPFFCVSDSITLGGVSLETSRGMGDGACARRQHNSRLTGLAIPSRLPAAFPPRPCTAAPRIDSPAL